MNRCWYCGKVEEFIGEPQHLAAITTELCDKCERLLKAQKQMKDAQEAARLVSKPEFINDFGTIETEEHWAIKADQAITEGYKVMLKYIGDLSPREFRMASYLIMDCLNVEFAETMLGKSLKMHKEQYSKRQQEKENK